MIDEIGRTDSGKVFSTFVRFHHFFDDRNQFFDRVADFLRRSRSHFLLDFDLKSFADSFEHDFLCRGFALADRDLVDILHVLEVANIEPGDQ